MSERSSKPAAGRALVRVACIGFGRVAQDYYTPALHRIAGVQVRAVADPLAQSCQRAIAAFPGCKAYSESREMLAAESLDAVLVASPPSTHLEIWRQLNHLGLAVFMEKPFVLAGQLEALPAARAPLMINFNRRFWPAYRRLAQLAATPQTGKVMRIKAVLHIDVLRWSTVTQHRLSPEEGGVLFDLGSQALDLVCMIAGAEPKSLSISVHSRRWPGDHIVLESQFPSGAHGTCDLAYADYNREEVAVEGTAGTWRLANPNMSVHWLAAGTAGPGVLGAMGDLAVLGYRGLLRSRSMLRYSIAAALRMFFDGVRNGGPLRPGLEDAVANVRWLETAGATSKQAAEAIR